MLRDGQFIKEDPPRIGAFYVPSFRPRYVTPEESMAQSILLGIEQKRASLLSRIFGLMLRV